MTSVARRLRGRAVAVACALVCAGCFLGGASPARADGLGSQFRITNQGHDGDTSYLAWFQDMAYDPQTNQHLVVFLNDDPTNGTTLEGQIVDASGNLVGAAFPISPLGGAEDFEPPSVTYDATDDEFLVAWNLDPGHVLGQLVSSSGALVGSMITVSSATYQDIETSDISWSPDADEFLVAWKAGDPGQIFGRRISGAGVPLDASDLQISHVIDTGGTGADDAMATAYNTVDHEFLVAWRGKDSVQAPNREYEIWGQRVALDGTDVGPSDFRISHNGSDTDQNGLHAARPNIAFDASRDQYLVVFLSDVVPPSAGTQDVEVFGQFVAGSGTLFGSTFQISNLGTTLPAIGTSGPGANGPDVTYNPYSDLYVTDFQASPNGQGNMANAEIYGDYLTGAGALTGTRDFQISDMGSSSNPNLAGLRPSVDLNSQTCDFMSTWFGDTTTGSLVNNQFEVWGRRVSAPACPPPIATTGSATGITTTGATLNGTVNPKGHATTFHFEYGTTASYGSSTASQSAGADFADHAESAAISGLAPGTTYHFRIVATNADGTSFGADMTFKTSSPPAVPAAARKHLKLSVSPHSALAGQRVCYSFKAMSGGHGVSGVTIRFTGRTKHTSSHGKATICETLQRHGTYTAHASKSGYTSATARVTVKARPKPKPKPVFTG